MSPNLPTSFWSRMGLREEDRDICVRAIQRSYPEHSVDEIQDQGYCSFTLAVSPRIDLCEKGGTYIVQIRPEQHALDISVANAARKTYGEIVPEVITLDCELPGRLRAVKMGRLGGMPLSKVNMERVSWDNQVRLVESFARFMARAWPASMDKPSAQHVRADTPTEGLWLEQHCRSKVGREIMPKLRKLAANLPDEDLRARVKETLAQLLAIENYPVVLNHGDLIPSNILVDDNSLVITGLVDWAEAEMLPFGMCFYGLEYLLGHLETVPSICGGGERPVWRYHQQSDTLRRLFWQTLRSERPQVEGREEEMRCMRDAGVLLWFGYAWDEGAIDRVVNEADTREMTCVRAFLAVR